MLDTIPKELVDKIAWYMHDGNNESPSFTEYVISTNCNGAKSVYALDLNGDGYPDVMSASYLDDKIAWSMHGGNNESPSFKEYVISTNADGARSVYALDLNGDG